MLLCFAACGRLEPNGVPAEEGIRITLDCGDIVTKTPRPGVGNENQINTVDYFLFDLDPATTNKYLYKGHSEPKTSSKFTFYIQTALDGGYGSLSAKEYTVFVIVNFPASRLAELGVNGAPADASDRRTLEELQNILMDDSSDHTFSATGIVPSSNDNLNLVMTGSITVTPNLSATGELAGSGTINLNRLASKVTMDFYLKDEVTNAAGTETWVPMTDGNNIRVYLCNGSKTVKLGSVSESLFDYEPNLDNTLISGKADYSTAFSSTAFYTYPRTWSYGDTDEPYLKLIVPWKLTRSNGSVTTSSQKEFYYKVMLPTDKFESNSWYHLSLDVTQLGSDTDDASVTLKPASFTVANWSNAPDIESVLAPAYYLEVNDAHYTLAFYGNSIEIPYFASGPVTFTVEEATYTDFLSGANVNLPQNSGTDFYTLSEGEDYFTLSHVLKTNYDLTNYHVSPFKFRIKLHLTSAGSDTKLDKTVNVTQYPPLFIETIPQNEATNNSTRYVYINGNTNPSTASTGTSTTTTNIWDNSGTNTLNASNHAHFLGSLGTPYGSMNPSSGENKNPNIYKVSATVIQLPVTVDGQTLDAVIGDPRVPVTQVVSYNTSTTKINGGTNGHELTDYRPTADYAKNVIAPEFICASSYGKTSPVTYEGAVKRCAAYQEHGYPAGRWRLPTPAEVKFLQKLSIDGKISELFNADPIWGYWAAGSEIFLAETTGSGVDMVYNNRFQKIDGEFTIKYTNVTRTAEFKGSTVSLGSSSYLFYQKGSDVNTQYLASVRCVYDTWYWGSEPVGATSNSWLDFQP